MHLRLVPCWVLVCLLNFIQGSNKIRRSSFLGPSVKLVNSCVFQEFVPSLSFRSFKSSRDYSLAAGYYILSLDSSFCSLSNRDPSHVDIFSFSNVRMAEKDVCNNRFVHNENDTRICWWRFGTFSSKMHNYHSETTDCDNDADKTQNIHPEWFFPPFFHVLMMVVDTGILFFGETCGLIYALLNC